MEPADKLFVQRIGERWTFGREGTAFETFATEEQAVLRAKEFAKRHPGTRVVVIDEGGRERAA